MTRASGFVSILAAGQGVTGAFALATVATLILRVATLIERTVPKLFWLRAQNQPGRDLDRLLDRSDLTVDQSAMFFGMLQASRETMLRARCQYEAGKGDAPFRRSRSAAGRRRTLTPNPS
jgi:hypothetical protein